MTSAPARFRYAERPAAPPLRPWIHSYWRFDVLPGAPAEHVVPPDGCSSLVANSSPGRPPLLLASGPWLRPLVVAVRPGERYHGLRIRAGAARELLGAAPDELRDTVQPAARWLGPLAERVTAELAAADDVDGVAAALDRLFLARVAELPRPDALALDAAGRLAESGGELPIRALALALEVSERTLLRRFRRATGLAPKQYARIQRLLATVRGLLAGPTLWGRLAAAGGYADQAHLNRDLVELTGITPTEFARRVGVTLHDLQSTA